jgi:hypothetical protein
MIDPTTARIFQMGFHVADSTYTAVLRTPLQLGPGKPEITQLFFFAKAYKTYQAISILWHQGFPEDSIILMRTLYELMLQVSYTYMEPVKCANLFREFSDYGAYHIYQSLKKSNPERAESFLQDYPGKLQEIKDRYSSLRKKFNKKMDWFGMSISELAEKVGKSREHGLVYSYTSKFVHSDQATLHRYLSRRAEGLMVKCKPEIDTDYLTVLQSARLIIEISDYVNKHLNLNQDAVIDQAFIELEQHDQRYGEMMWGPGGRKNADRSRLGH